jgi:hypothetical protein
MLFCFPQKELLMKIVALYYDVFAWPPLEAIKKFGRKIQAAPAAACTAKFAILNIRQLRASRNEQAER